MSPSPHDDVSAYPDAYFSERESWRDWRIEAHELMRLAQVCAGERVLEVGCGAGGLLEKFVALGATATGVDTLGSALEMARRRDEAQYAVGPSHGRISRHDLVQIGASETLPFGSNTFNAVVSQHVAEHFADAHFAFCEWNRVLVPGGRIALATPNSHYPDPTHFADSDHTHIFAPAELKQAVEQAGFSVDHCSTVFPFLSRLGLCRAAGVIAYRMFQHAPYFSTHSRTILLSATKP